MSSTWDRIPQTHRTILFEEFTNPADNSAKNLYDILTLYSDSDASDEEMYKSIANNLEVRSFNEFLEKFPPRVFEYVMGQAGGEPYFHYTTNPIEAQRNGGREIKITAHTYYEMLVNMYSQKGSSGIANIEFDDAKLREILTPKREMEALYNTRRQIPLLMERYNAAVKKNENAKPIVKKLNDIRRVAINQTKDPSVVMSIYLDDIDRQVEAIDIKRKQLSLASPNGEETPKLLSGRGGFDNDGRWILIPAKASTPDSDESTDSPSDPQGDSVEKFAQTMKGDLDKHAKDESNFTKVLIVSAYTG